MENEWRLVGENKNYEDKEPREFSHALGVKREANRVCHLLRVVTRCDTDGHQLAEGNGSRVRLLHKLIRHPPETLALPRHRCSKAQGGTSGS